MPALVKSVYITLKREFKTLWLRLAVRVRVRVSPGVWGAVGAPHWEHFRNGLKINIINYNDATDRHTASVRCYIEGRVDS